MKSTFPFAWLLWAILTIPASGQTADSTIRSLQANVLKLETHQTRVDFNWSPVASHHGACVRVIAGGGVGSGTYVEFDGQTFVVTAAHVASAGQQVTVIFPNGEKKTGEATHDKYGIDVSCIPISEPNTKPIAMAASPPAVGEPLEFAGYAHSGFSNSTGEGNFILRHWVGRVERQTSENSYYSNAGVSAGDSGGGVFNSKGEFVGVISAGATPADNDNSYKHRTHQVVTGPYWTPVRNFLGRVCQRMQGGQFGQPCPPGGNCPPQGGGGLPPSRPREDDLFPPQRPPAPPIAQPDNLLPWREEIEQRIADLEARQLIPGPPGRDGKDGKQGPPGPPGKDGISPDPETIAQISAQFIQIDIEAIADALRDRQEPIYIGAKDEAGNITMPLTPVFPGDGVFIKVRPPALQGQN